MIPFLRSFTPPLARTAIRPAPGSDPLNSPVWSTMVERFLPDLPAVFDERVQVILPPVTEDQTQVPVTVDARGLGRVEEILVIADLNPFPVTLRLEPTRAQAFVAFRMKIEQGTPIRAAVRKDGGWYVGGRYLDAAGGGCSVPPTVESKADWVRMGEIRARLWREDAGLRLRLRIQHPMDTGMLNNIPLFLIETLAITDTSGGALAKLELKEPVADNPTLTLLTDEPQDGGGLRIVARNTSGIRYEAQVAKPAAGPAALQTPRKRESQL